MAKPAKTSAGLLLYRRRGADVEVLLGHMGGPFWARKDEGAWSLPKGEYDAASEDALAVARREFEEEMGSPPPAVLFVELGETRQAGGKLVTVWAAEGDFDAASAVSNSFALEWPKGSGRIRHFPEIDRAGWFPIEEARPKMVQGQRVFLDRLLARLAAA